MKKFFLNGITYDIKEYDSEVHKNIKCEDENCRVPIVYISNRVQSYFRVKHGLKHKDNCTVFKKSPKKGNSGIKKYRKIFNKGLIYWAFGKKTEVSNELIESSEKQIKIKKTDKDKEYFLSDGEKTDGVRNIHLKTLKDIKKIMNKKDIDWKKTNVSINEFVQRKLYSLISTPYKALEDLVQGENKKNYILVGKIIDLLDTSIGGHKLLKFEDSDFFIFINYDNLNKFKDLNQYMGRTVLVAGTLKNYCYKEIEIDSIEKIEVLKIDFNSTLNLLEDPLTQQMISVIKKKGFIDFDLTDIDGIVDGFIEYESVFKGKRDKLKNRLNTLIEEGFIEETSSPIAGDEWICYIKPTNKYHEIFNKKQPDLNKL